MAASKGESQAKVIRLSSLFWLVFLLVLVEISAVAVVYSTYRNRALFAELKMLEDEAQEMRVEWSQYLLEQSTLASYSRVVDVAQKELMMESPDPAQVVIFEH